jgi:hypothetical protein
MEVIILAVLSKDKRIKKEITKLKRLLINIDEDRKKAVEQQIQNAAWMAVALEDIRKQIDLSGYVEYYQNGQNQSGQKESSLVRTYNSLIKNYNATIKQITDNLPENQPQTNDKLAEFLLKKQ